MTGKEPIMNWRDGDVSMGSTDGSPPEQSDGDGVSRPIGADPLHESGVESAHTWVDEGFFGLLRLLGTDATAAAEQLEVDEP